MADTFFKSAVVLLALVAVVLFGIDMQEANTENTTVCPPSSDTHILYCAVGGSVITMRVYYDHGVVCGASGRVTNASCIGVPIGTAVEIRNFNNAEKEH